MCNDSPHAYDPGRRNLSAGERALSENVKLPTVQHIPCMPTPWGCTDSHACFLRM